MLSFAIFLYTYYSDPAMASNLMAMASKSTQKGEQEELGN